MLSEEMLMHNVEQLNKMNVNESTYHIGNSIKITKEACESAFTISDT